MYQYKVKVRTLKGVAIYHTMVNSWYEAWRSARDEFGKSCIVAVIPV